MKSIVTCILHRILLLTYLLTPWCRIFFKKPIVTQLVKKYPFFMKPEGSSPCSQIPATVPYPEPAESSLYFSPNIVRMIKSRRLRWAGHVARMGREEVLTGFWLGGPM
jgi:hypothetical protein